MYEGVHRMVCSAFICSTLFLGCTVASFGQKQTFEVPAISSFKKGSTKKSEVQDSTFYLVDFVMEESANNNLAVPYTLIRRLGNGQAIVCGLKVEDSLRYHSVHTVNDLWKLSKPLHNFEHKADVEQLYTLIVRYDKGEKEARKLLNKIKIRHVRNSTILVECTFNDILKYVLPLKEVVYVGLESQQARVESRVLDLNLAPNNISYVHHTYPSLDGSGYTLSIKENAFDKNDIDLQGRTISSSLSSPTLDLHATEMATIAAGAGNSFVTGRGVVRAATLASSDFAVLGADPNSEYERLSVNVQNHSYGTDIENVYGALAVSFDESARSIPTLLHVFSSGNNGMLASTSGAYAGITGFANLTGNFKMAKNILTVGSVDTVGRTISFSSRGPAYDGRVKPEVVAYSTAGSSNSAALVSGMAVMLQQVYEDAYGVLPSSDLLRALLITGAKDVGAAGIDFITGYGNVDLAASVDIVQKANFRSGSASAGETINFDITIPASARRLKITLVWNDLPARANDVVAIVNDLDLKLRNPTGEEILPWKLNAAASVEALTSLPVRGEDHLNTTEQITLDDLPVGTYTISVRGHAIASGSQEFQIAYQWEEKEEFTWLYPTGSDNFPYNGEAGTYFQWKSTLTANTGLLEYSVDSGISWTTIRGGIDLSNGFLRWDAPQINAVAQARMRVGTDSFVTERFTISRPVTTSVGFNCTDSVMLNWRKVPGAQYYKVKSFVNSQLEDFRELTDTSIIIDKAVASSLLYSVQAVFPTDVKGIQGYTVNYNDQGIACYLSSFFVELMGTDGILLKVQLGTTYQVKQIVFERAEGSNFIQLATIQNLSSPAINFLDMEPQQGLNSYRVRVQFYNGEEVISDVASDYFLTEIPFLLFPNPVRVGEDLQIIAKQFENQQVQFDLYKSDGAKVFSQQLLSDRESITIPMIATGLYLYSIKTEEGIVRGKLIVL